jgi:predicted metal-binding protein
MSVEFNEPVRVAAVFTCGEVCPVWFDRKGMQVRIRNTAFTWTTREGNATVMHFSVTDGRSLYELCFHTGTLSWQLAFSEAP